MKITYRTLILILIVLLLSAVSCQKAPETAAPRSPVQPTSAATKVSGGASEISTGQFVLDVPDQGLSARASYRQRLTSTIKGTLEGQPYSYSETVERTVSGTDETTWVEATTNGDVLYLYTARLGETVYSQTNPESPCRAAPAAEQPVRKNPALKLPPVYGAALMKKESLDGMPAASYAFDGRAVPNVAGKTDDAAGELWLADQGNTLLRYDLTVQVKEGDFTGERAWRYTLETGDFDPTLPQNCQPLLDIPIPPNAEDVVNQPGFTRYTVQSGYEGVRQFYLTAMPGAGWEPLPATRMGPDAGAPKDVVVLTFAKANADAGGRVAVIQLIEADKGLIAAVQVIETKIAVKSYDPSEKAPAPGEDDEQPSEPEGPVVQPKLPDVVVAYPGGTVVAENEAMVMFTTPDTPEKVMEFYTAAFEEDGWQQIEDTSVQGTLMRCWEKGAQQVRIVVSKQANWTSVIITPG